MRTEGAILSRMAWPDWLRRASRRCARWLWTCAERSAQRRTLAELDSHRLRDIGRTREEARAEAGKPFWRR
jgi:uncharacterized protein YjiS (DUF1127 family)